jgi:hypothetical protein
MWSGKSTYYDSDHTLLLTLAIDFCSRICKRLSSYSCSSVSLMQILGRIASIIWSNEKQKSRETHDRFHLFFSLFLFTLTLSLLEQKTKRTMRVAVCKYDLLSDHDTHVYLNCNHFQWGRYHYGGVTWAFHTLMCVIHRTTPYSSQSFPAFLEPELKIWRNGVRTISYR